MELNCSWEFANQNIKFLPFPEQVKIFSKFSDEIKNFSYNSEYNYFQFFKISHFPFPKCKNKILYPCNTKFITLATLIRSFWLSLRKSKSEIFLCQFFHRFIDIFSMFQNSIDIFRYLKISIISIKYHIPIFYNVESGLFPTMFAFSGTGKKIGTILTNYWRNKLDFRI